MQLINFVSKLFTVWERTISVWAFLDTEKLLLIALKVVVQNS